mgnify:CR=1 FL=1
MVRLFANMMAGHIIIICLVSLIFIFGALNKGIGLGFSPVSIAFAVFIYVIEVLVAFIQAFIFTILHLSLYEFLGIFMMGSVLGIISYRNNSLWYNGITHFTFNAVTVILHFVLLTNFEKTGVMGNPESFLNNFFVAIPASLIFGFTFYQLTKKDNE